MQVNIMLYIFWFLHQTTTYAEIGLPWMGCISFDSYIKPQLSHTAMVISESCISFDSYIKPQPRKLQVEIQKCCISFDSYIKPQHAESAKLLQLVVYLLIPTSNHNALSGDLSILALYIFWFLHQTTTKARRRAMRERLYIFWFLHQTTTEIVFWKFGGMLYIFWFLHQTTTFDSPALARECCISFDSYIKPQQVTSFFEMF